MSECNIYSVYYFLFYLFIYARRQEGVHIIQYEEFIFIIYDQRI